MVGGLPGSERNWKVRGFRARLDTHEECEGQFHVSTIRVLVYVSAGKGGDIHVLS